MRHHHSRDVVHSYDEDGASLVEYALLLALIAVVVFGSVSFFGSNNAAGFARSTDCFEAAYENALTDECD